MADAPPSAPPDRPTCLYRIWGQVGDEINRLLYVGITMNIDGRFSKHRRRPWWPDVSTIDLEWFDDRSVALDAETYVINVGNPLYNIVRPKMGRR